MLLRRLAEYLCIPDASITLDQCMYSAVTRTGTSTRTSVVSSTCHSTGIQRNSSTCHSTAIQQDSSVVYRAPSGRKLRSGSPRLWSRALPLSPILLHRPAGCQYIPDASIRAGTFTHHALSLALSPSHSLSPSVARSLALSVSRLCKRPFASSIPSTPSSLAIQLPYYESHLSPDRPASTVTCHLTSLLRQTAYTGRASVHLRQSILIIVSLKSFHPEAHQLIVYFSLLPN